MRCDICLTALFLALIVKFFFVHRVSQSGIKVKMKFISSFCGEKCFGNLPYFSAESRPACRSLKSEEWIGKAQKPVKKENIVVCCAFWIKYKLFLSRIRMWIFKVLSFGHGGNLFSLHFFFFLSCLSENYQINKKHTRVQPVYFYHFLEVFLN